MSDTSIDSMLLEIRREFIETTAERLTTADDLISAMMEGGSDFDQSMMEFQRHLHSIKGMSGTFDFPIVSTIAHRLEDYIETAAELKNAQLQDIQRFVDIIREILETDKTPDESEAKSILSSLPVTASTTASTSTFSDQAPSRDVKILLVMEKGTQRRIIGKELASCGFHIGNADTPLAAIALALAHPPDIIVASRVMQEMSGQELAGVMNLLEATRNCRMVIATSTAKTDVNTDTLPSGTAVIQKGAKFSEDLTEHLINWGYFGDIGNTSAST